MAGDDDREGAEELANAEDEREIRRVAGVLQRLDGRLSLRQVEDAADDEARRATAWSNRAGRNRQPGLFARNFAVCSRSPARTFNICAAPPPC